MGTPSSSLLPAFLFLLLLFTFKHAAGDAFTDTISINCGSAAPSPSIGAKEWMPDVYSIFSPSAVVVKCISSRTSVSKQLTVDPVPYATARISTSQFSYNFRLVPGQKFIRLHFSPNSYKFNSGFFEKRLEDYFSVQAGPFTLLANFSASITARALRRNVVTKEFCVDTRESMDFSLVFTPALAANPLQGFYAFINGIEITSEPSSRSYCHYGDDGVQIVGQKSVVYIDSSIALEMAHRLDVKGYFVASGAGDGMFRIRERAKKVRYDPWKIPVDVGFRYLIILHFCEISLQMAEKENRDFMILINGTIAVTNADITRGREGKGMPMPRYKNYVVMVNGNKNEGKRDILISLHSKEEFVDGYGPLEGFETFKLSNPDNSLATPNPLPSTGDSLPLTSQSLLTAVGPTNALAAVVIMLICMVNIVVHKLRHSCEVNLPEEVNLLCPRATSFCRCFTLSEIQLATENFFDGFVIGKGGFGKVYMGRIDNGKQIVAIKRLKRSSSQGKREFQTEIELLSELRHVNVVSLVGYCSEKGEMILVYEHVPGGSLADHLYKLPRKDEISSSLSWKQRLEVCIGAGRGLDYLHTGHGIIHRDIKSLNILLDENFVAKVSDFGLAKIHTGQSHASTNFKGTFGYIDPDYVRTHRLTMKSDTYSFGVMLLEVLCGRPAVEPGVEEDKRSLTMWARDTISKGDVDEIVAPSLRDEISPTSLKAFVWIAEKCLHDEPKKRPAIAHIIINLEFALEQQVNANSSPNEIAGLVDVLPVNNTTQPKNVSPLPPNEIEQVSIPQQGNTQSYSPNEIENVADAITDTFGRVKAQPFLSMQLKKVVTTTKHRLSQLWSWDGIWKSGKVFKRINHVTVSAPVTHRTVRSGDKPPTEDRTIADAATFTDIYGQENEQSVLTTQQMVGSTSKHTATSSNMKPVTNSLKNVVKTTIHNVGGLWPWHTIRKRAKPKREELSISMSVPVRTRANCPEYYSYGELLLRPNLRVFSFENLKVMTRNFCSDAYLGEGGFGTVYKGFLKENGTESAVAIKILSPESLQGFQEWQSEINFLGRLSHQNIVKLMGYCWEDKELSLVYEFMSLGSLENLLFRKKLPFPWDVRLQILIGAARGLSFLHTLARNIIYRDFKASNILLDGSYHAKLSDFGLAKLGPHGDRSHVSTRVMGTYGYAAPEYIATGHLTVKSDVYGFGVVILEMLTGLRVIDKNRPSGKVNLVEWAKPYLLNKRKLEMIMDPRLGTSEVNYPRKGAFKLAQLARNCLEPNPKFRASSKEIVEELERIQSMYLLSSCDGNSIPLGIVQTQESPLIHSTRASSSTARIGKKVGWVS